MQMCRIIPTQAIKKSTGYPPQKTDLLRISYQFFEIFRCRHTATKLCAQKHLQNLQKYCIIPLLCQAGSQRCPVTYNPLQQGRMLQAAFCVGSWKAQGVLISRSCATRLCEPCQGGNAAALSSMIVCHKVALKQPPTKIPFRRRLSTATHSLEISKELPKEQFLFLKLFYTKRLVAFTFFFADSTNFKQKSTEIIDFDTLLAYIY